MPFQLALFVSRLLAEHRREIGTRGRDPRPDLLEAGGLRAGLVPGPAGHPPARQGFGISQSTAYRYKDEGVEVLAAQAPSLEEALDKAVEQGLPYLILDGTLISSDRCSDKKTSRKGTEIDKWYSGKAHEHAGLVQGIISPDGVPLWASEVRPGSTHDITAARELVLPGLRPWLKIFPCLADSGYEGAGAGRARPGEKAPQRRPRYRREMPQRAPPRPPLPGRTRLRPPEGTLARPPARHRQPDPDRRHRESRTRSHANRAQDDRLKVAGKTSLCRTYRRIRSDRTSEFGHTP